MLWGWLQAICSALFETLAGMIWKKVEQPKTLTDEKTPDGIKRDWNNTVADELRDKNGGH
jgi:hypothetical protein